MEPSWKKALLQLRKHGIPMNTKNSRYLPPRHTLASGIVLLVLLLAFAVFCTLGCMTAKPYVSRNQPVIEYGTPTSPQEDRRRARCEEMRGEYVSAKRWCEDQNVSTTVRDASCRTVADYRNDCISDAGSPMVSSTSDAGVPDGSAQNQAPITE